MPRRTPRTARPELTAERRAEADRIHAAMLEAAADDLRELAELLAARDDTDTFGATEFTVRDIVLRVGAQAIQTALERRKKGYDVSSRACPDCRQPAKFQRRRVKAVVTLLG